MLFLLTVMQMLSYHPPLKERIIGKNLQVEEPSRHIEAQELEC